jgi:hypothetical protein
MIGTYLLFMQRDHFPWNNLRELDTSLSHAFGIVKEQGICDREQLAHIGLITQPLYQINAILGVAPTNWD